MKNIKLVIEYDGTNYAGWQKQKNAITIQQVLEEALLRLTNEKISITGSGRTDSGVHARGQVANFFTKSQIPADRFSHALNGILPYDIRIVNSSYVSKNFHARYSAVGKRYRYSFVINPHGVAIGRQYFYHVRHNVDIKSMENALLYVVGTHDFSAFQATGSSVKTTIRTVHTATLKWESPYLLFDISGNGFLYNMVRILSGTLIEVGKGRIKPEDIPGIIESRDRSQAGPTAPAQGLSLEEVFY